MPAQSIGTSETAATSPLAALLQLSLANELLLSGMKSFVALSVVLARKGFPAHCTHKWTFIGVGTKMRTKVISTSKPFWTQIALESCGVFLNSLGVATICRCGLVFRVCKSKDIVSVW
jgi:hypothetical protein